MNTMYYWSLLGHMMLCFIDFLLCLILPLVLVRLVAPQVIFSFLLNIQLNGCNHLQWI